MRVLAVVIQRHVAFYHMLVLGYVPENGAHMLYAGKHQRHGFVVQNFVEAVVYFQHPLAHAFVLFVASMLFMHLENKLVPVSLLVAFGALFVGTLYAWLTTPLEDAHH